MTNSILTWDTGNGTTDGICFSVDTDGVQLCGVGVYVGGTKEHRYELKVLSQVKLNYIWQDEVPSRKVRIVYCQIITLLLFFSLALASSVIALYSYGCVWLLIIW